MGKQLNRHAHNDRDHRNGQYRKSNPCDACGKPVWTAYYTDEEVCGNTDGPGFFLCDRAKCHKKRDFPLEVRRALYTAQRAINDTAERSPAPETHEDRKRAKFKRAEFEAKRAALRATNVKSSESVTPCDSCDGLVSVGRLATTRVPAKGRRYLIPGAPNAAIASGPRTVTRHWRSVGSVGSPTPAFDASKTESPKPPL